jgi:hypothetical protein
MVSASRLLRFVCVLLTIALWAITITTHLTPNSIAAAAALTAIVGLLVIPTWEEGKKPRSFRRPERSRSRQIAEMTVRTAVEWGPIIVGVVFILIALLAALGSYSD